MNPNSLSVSDAGKSNAQIKLGIRDTDAASTGDDSESFLSKLSALFSSEQPEQGEAIANNGDAASVDELTALMEGEGEPAIESEQIAEGDPEALIAESQIDPEADAGKAMGEGSALLDRLDDSKLALSDAPGKGLPQQAGDSEQLAEVESNAALALSSADRSELSPQIGAQSSMVGKQASQDSTDLSVASEAASDQPLAQGGIDGAQVSGLDSTAEGDLPVASHVSAINWGSQSAEQSKAPIDKTAVLAASAGLQAMAASAGQQAGLVVDKQTATPVATAVEQGAAQISSLAAAPLMQAETPSQQQSMKAALAGVGGLAALKGMSENKTSEGKDANLSQQLAGLASQNGLQQTQLKEVQQAMQQSPLQLAKEAAPDKLAEQVQMMLSKNLKNIDIRLDPPELGRMQIRMNMSNDVASVHFTVANQQAKDAVDQAMPRLREMLSQQGLQLADTSVQQQGARQQQSQYLAGQGQGSGAGDDQQSHEDGQNLDESINLTANIARKDDGISFYA